MRTFSGVPLAILRRQLNRKSTRPTRKAFPDELKSFALTLAFYSLKAYNYVRKTFNLCLPHPSTLRHWYKSVNGEPGFTDEAFVALSMRVDEAVRMQERVIVSLMFDEMSIMKHVEWNGSKFVGYVDVGNGVEDDSVPVASEALVFMVVALNSNWKVPVGYFLINGMNGAERANLIKQCLLKLHDIGVEVASVTCDGPSCNFSMMEAMGVKLDPPDMKSYFLHPADSSVRVYIILDACHMLKLVRNCLGSYGILQDGTGGKINWNYIEQLHILQEKEGLRLGTKLKSAHIMWSKMKMKVNIAVQTLSSSVADAIDFCRSSLKLYQFANSEATVNFLRIVDRLFDLLNSRNPVARGYKSPLKLANVSVWRSFLDDAKGYLLSLTDVNNVPLYKTKRKTPIIGLLCTIESVIGIFNDYCGKDNSPLKYLLTYKLSQDHLELFFGAVRASCGSNNNPNVRQFIAAYKRLLMRHNIEGGLGNCLRQDQTALLNVDVVCEQSGDYNTDSLDMSMARFYDIPTRKPICDDHDYADMPPINTLSDYKTAVVTYIAGFVVRMVKRKISCPRCTAALTADVTVNGGIGEQFLKLKNRGGLVRASDCVIKVCQATEKCFSRMHAARGDQLPLTSRIVPIITSTVLSEVAHCCFQSLNSHMYDCTPDSNHLFILIKCVASCYCTVRMHHLAKQKSSSIAGVKIRKQLSKIILFKNQ